MTDGGDASEKLERLAQLAKDQRAQVRDYIRSQVNDFADKTWADIGDNLSNKVLRRVTGRLATSIRREVMDTGDYFNVSFGSNVPYAAIQEFGGTISHPGGTAYFFDPKRGAAVFISNAVAGAGWPEVLRTKPHTITVPARPYMRPPIEANREIMRNNIREGIARMLEGFGRA